MVVVLTLLSTSLSLSHADLATVVVAEPRLLCAKANTIAANARPSSSTLSRRPAATTSGGKGRGGVGHGCCKRRCRWLQTALIPSLPRPFNQTKN
uniref:Secreted protein n=1 Tax=Oryza barthii TaxID=65489 RepID=A0A0D3EKV6_9ORYZ